MIRMTRWSVSIQSSLTPHYGTLLTQLRPASNLGFLILQRTGQLGIKRLLSEDFNQEFSGLYPQFHLEINPLVPEQLVEDYLSRGRITKIRFVRNSIPTDFADFVNSGGNFRQTTGSMEYSIKVGRGQRISVPVPIRQFLNGERNLNNLLELQSFEYDNVKIQLELGGSSRTIDLSHLGRLRAHYDVGDDVEIGENGHPLFDSIDGIAMGLLNDISPRNAVR